MVVVMVETTNRIRVNILNIAVRVFGSSFLATVNFLPELLSPLVIRQKKRMTSS